MKIKLIDVDYTNPDDGVSISLADCGFKIGDVVEVSDKYSDGLLLVTAIRKTRFVSIGNDVCAQKCEYEVIEE